MKLIAYLIITVSVVVGSLASATAYLAPLSTTRDEKLIGLELTSDAGAYMPDKATKEFKERLDEIHEAIDEKKEAEAENPLKPKDPDTPTEGDDETQAEPADGDATAEGEEAEADPSESEEPKTEPTGEKLLADAEQPKPIGRSGDTLNAALLEILRDEKVKFVKVNRFHFFRWPHWWLFVLSCVGLIGGALLVRHDRKAELARASTMVEGAPENPADARTVFARLSGRLNALADDMARAGTEEEKLDAIVRRIGFIQRDDVPAFVADRPALVGRMGLGGYAELMDHFAAMERQLNRAWSAAADGHLHEAEASLAAAQPMLLHTLAKLKG